MRTQFVYILANTTSGSGHGAQILQEVTDFCQQQNIGYITFITEYAQHAFDLTRQINYLCANRPQAKFIVIGGDGTLHEAVSTLRQLNSQLPIGYIAAGTGNDFYRSLYAKQSTLQRLQTILSAHEPTRVPVIAHDDNTAINSFGMGFDAQVLNLVTHSKLKPFLSKIGLSSTVYLLSALRLFTKFKTCDITININDTQTYTFDKVFLMGIFNNPYFGGGIKIDPAMHLLTPTLSCIVINRVKFRDIIRCLPKVLRGTHLSDAIFQRFDLSHATLTIHKPTTAQIDGELTDIAASNIHFSLAYYLFW